MTLWNQRDLVPPTPMNVAVNSEHIKPQISALTVTAGNMLNYLSSMKKFERAAAFLSRFCNRWKLRFRNMHGFRIMRRINQTLLRIKSVGVSWDVLNFHSSLPEGTYIANVVNLPVRSNLEYLLVRLQGLVKLCLRVIHLTKEATRYQLKQISDGFLYFHNSMFMALMGELWVLSRKVCLQVDCFYGELYVVLPILPESDEYWLPDDYQLPASLAEWLGDEFRDEVVRAGDKNGPLDLAEEPSIFTLLQHRGSDEDVLTQIEEIAAIADKADDSESVGTSISVIPKMMLLEAMRSDTGEVVTSPPSASTARRVTKKAPFDPAKLNHIRSKFHVKQFLADERTKRTNKSKLATTSDVSESQFGDFNVRLMKEFNRLSSADFVSFFKKQLVALLGVPPGT